MPAAPRRPESELVAPEGASPFPGSSGLGAGPDAVPVDPAAWDPLYAVAGDLKYSFILPIQEGIFEALCVLKDLCGLPHVVEDDWAVAALAYTLVDALTRDVPLPGPRRARLLQIVAANLYHSNRNTTFLSPAFFWTFVNELSRKYQKASTAGRDKVKLVDMIDEFLGHYDLGGPENQDVLSAIHRIVTPLIRGARALLLEKAHLLSLPSAR